MEGAPPLPRHNGRQGVATLSVFITAFATLALAIGTFWMSCETKKAANATRDSVRRQVTAYSEGTRPWFEASIDRLVPFPSRKEVTYAVSVVNHGPGVASSFRPTVELSLLPDRIDLHRELLAGTLESGVVGVGEIRQLQRANIPYDTVGGSDPKAAYMHVCCCYRSAATGTGYYMDHVLYFLPVACSTDAPEELRRYPEHYRGSKLAYFATVEDSAGATILRWKE